MRNIMAIGLMIFLLAPAAFSQELTADDIIQKVNDQFNTETSYAKSKMTIVTTSGQKKDLYTGILE